MRPPNPRVQRARSAPSAPHEPLTRHPLGAAGKDHAGSLIVPSPETHGHARPRAVATVRQRLGWTLQ